MERAALAILLRWPCVVECGGWRMGCGTSLVSYKGFGYRTGGWFVGPRRKGLALPGVGNWSRGGRLGEASSVGTFDARAVWRTDDGDLVYLSYTGRSLIPDDVRATFADPAVPDADPSRYYLDRKSTRLNSSH